MTPESAILFRDHLREGVIKACLKMNEVTRRAEVEPDNQDAQLQHAYWAGAYCALKGALEHFDEVS